MDIIYFFIEFYYNVEFKFNFKFEIEVFCKCFDFDYEVIELFGEILNWFFFEDVGDLVGLDNFDSFESLFFNGMMGVNSLFVLYLVFVIFDLGFNLSVLFIEVVSVVKLYDIVC